MQTLCVIPARNFDRIFRYRTKNSIVQRLPKVVRAMLRKFGRTHAEETHLRYLDILVVI